MKLRLPNYIIEAELSKYDSSALSIESVPDWVLYDLNTLHRYALCTYLGLSEEYVRLGFTDNMYKYIQEYLRKNLDKEVCVQFQMVISSLSTIFNENRCSSIKKAELLRDFISCCEEYIKEGYPVEIDNLYDFELYLDVLNNGVGYKSILEVEKNKQFLLSVETDRCLDKAIMIINKYEVNTAYKILKLDNEGFNKLKDYEGKECFHTLLDCLYEGLDISDIDLSKYPNNIIYNIVIAKNTGVDISNYTETTTNKEILNDINLAKLKNEELSNKNLKFI